MAPTVAQQLERARERLLTIDSRLALNEVSASFKSNLPRWRRSVGEAATASAIGRLFLELITATEQCQFTESMTVVRQLAITALEGANSSNLSFRQLLTNLDRTDIVGRAEEKYFMWTIWYLVGTYTVKNNQHCQ